MHLTGVYAGALLAATAIAAPNLAPRYITHESRGTVPHGWSREERVKKDYKIPMKFALKQANIENIDALLHDVSSPTSENYGKHWDAARIAKHFAPSQETVDTVHSWLTSSGIDKSRVKLTPGWIRLEATIEEAEQLLQTEYSVYRHGTGQPHIACETYGLPEHVSKHVDFVTPTVHFDAKVNAPGKIVDGEFEKRTVTKPVGEAKGVGAPGSNFQPKYFPIADNSSIPGELAQCSEYITPVCLEYLYKIPPIITSVQKNPIGIVEYTPQAYNQSDLNLFFANYSINQKQKVPTLISIDGGFDDTMYPSIETGVESNLDLQYAMALVNPQPVLLYQAGDPYEGASFGDFLDALDSSYCGGDDPVQDSMYPDLEYAGLPGAYEGAKSCGTAPLAKVISTSYAYNEADLTPSYEMRQCNEYAKLGMMGTSFFFSSGDYGVAGNGGQCLDPTNHTAPYTNGSYGAFNPSFPGTCPYITSVGATQIVPGASVTAPEEACETVIYSGGGFSNYFPMPAYQKAAVQSYFKNYPPPYSSVQYNNSRTTRGFPDISANGAEYVVYIGGRRYHVFGTSCSSPVSASIFSIINEYRALAGKSSVGFINPVLYAHPYAFNDITKGGNQGCGTPGFTAVPGWDPVTGLGTPNTPALISLFVALP